jgi:hypothetical protein
MTHVAERYALMTDIEIILAVAVARVVLAGAVAGIGFGAYSAWDYYARTGNWRGAIRCGMRMAAFAFTVTIFSPYVSKTYAAYYSSASFFVGYAIHRWRCGG